MPTLASLGHVDFLQHRDLEGVCASREPMEDCGPGGRYDLLVIVNVEPGRTNERSTEATRGACGAKTSPKETGRSSPMTWIAPPASFDRISRVT